ncbi:hypothetical protein D3C75_1105090 [compost metagenome]
MQHQYGFLQFCRFQRFRRWLRFTHRLCMMEGRLWRRSGSRRHIVSARLTTHNRLLRLFVLVLGIVIQQDVIVIRTLGERRGLGWPRRRLSCWSWPWCNHRLFACDIDMAH